MNSKLRRQNETLHEEKFVNLKDKNGQNFFKLEKLNISCCDVLSIPNVVFSFKYLTELDLSNNSLESLPEEIGNLHNLLVLNLCGNKLMSLPKSLRLVHQLTVLNASYNKLIEVPEVLYCGLRFIKILDLSFNDISQFWEPPECLTKLLELRLSNNSLQTLPAWIFDNLCQLEILDLSENRLSFNSGAAFHYYHTGIFESLKVLKCEHCNLRLEQIQFISFFKKLEALYLGNKEASIMKGKNYLGNFKMGLFRNFQSIKYLYLENIEISTLPEDFDSLVNLESLNLSDNMLSWLPESFCNLVSLKDLFLTSNQLLFLPNNFGNLINLRQINLGNNKLYLLPKSFYNLRNLEFIDLYNNEIEKVDHVIFTHKKLCGIDLGMNHLDFLDCLTTSDKIILLYNSLKTAFRQKYKKLNYRIDLQKKKAPDELKESSYLVSDCHSISSSSNSSSSENEQTLDCENLAQGCVEQAGCCEADADWDEKPEEEDELFDPHDVDDSQSSKRTSWESHFRNNFCPASSHARSVMRTYVRNFKLAARNETFEEGQFDSD